MTNWAKIPEKVYIPVWDIWFAFAYSYITCAEYLVGVRSSASPTVIGRKDFEPLGQHKYAFTILTATR